MRWYIDIDDHTRFQSFSLYFLMFIHIGSRRIWISPCTANPTGEWTAHQARNFEMYLQEENLPCKTFSVIGIQNMWRRSITYAGWSENKALT